MLAPLPSRTHTNTTRLPLPLLVAGARAQAPWRASSPSRAPHRRTATPSPACARDKACGVGGGRDGASARIGGTSASGGGSGRPMCPAAAARRAAAAGVHSLCVHVWHPLTSHWGRGGWGLHERGRQGPCAPPLIIHLPLLLSPGTAPRHTLAAAAAGAALAPAPPPPVPGNTQAPPAAPTVPGSAGAGGRRRGAARTTAAPLLGWRRPLIWARLPGTAEGRWICVGGVGGGGGSLHVLLQKVGGHARWRQHEPRERAAAAAAAAAARAPPPLAPPSDLAAAGLLVGSQQHEWQQVSQAQNRPGVQHAAGGQGGQRCMGGGARGQRQVNQVAHLPRHLGREAGRAGRCACVGVGGGTANQRARPPPTQTHPPPPLRKHTPVGSLRQCRERQHTRRRTPSMRSCLC